MAESRRLVLVGAGHAHLATLHTLDRFVRAGVDVTVINPDPVLWYSGMVPAALAGDVAHRAACIPVADIVRRSGARWLEDSVRSLDADSRRVIVKSGEPLMYDIASVATGSEVPPAPSDMTHVPVIPVKPMAALVERTEELVQRVRHGSAYAVAVLGGGPSGVEIAGALARRLRGSDCSVSLVARSSRLLSRLPPAAGAAAQRQLEVAGVKLTAGVGVDWVTDTGITLADGRELVCDVVYDARGLQASNPPGPIVVDTRLSAYGGTLFAGGDCASVAGYEVPAVGVHAVMEGPIIRDNLLRACGLSPLARQQTFEPPRRYLLVINTGDGVGIAVRGPMVATGRIWLALKRRIDWAFVRSEGRSIRPTFSAPPRPER